MALQVTEVQKALKGASYPASGDDLAEIAKGNGADRDVIDAVSDIDGEVSGPDQVMHHLKGSLTGERD